MLNAFTLAALAVGVAGLPGTASAQDAGAPQAVTGEGFTTAISAGWTVRPYKARSGRNWGFASAGATTSTTTAIPTKGGIGVTVWVGDVATMKRFLARRGRKLPRDKRALCATLMSAPPGARHIRRRSTPRPAAIAGVEGAAMTITYRLRSRDIVQRDVVVRRGSKLYVAELDVDRANAAAGQEALRGVLAAWAWT